MRPGSLQRLVRRLEGEAGPVEHAAGATQTQCTCSRYGSQTREVTPGVMTCRPQPDPPCSLSTNVFDTGPLTFSILEAVPGKFLDETKSLSSVHEVAGQVAWRILEVLDEALVNLGIYGTAVDSKLP